jgi:hypothetical protein
MVIIGHFYGGFMFLILNIFIQNPLLRRVAVSYLILKIIILSCGMAFRLCHTICI